MVRVRLVKDMFGDMKLSEFEVRCVGLGRPGAALVDLAQAVEAGSGEECARAMSEVLRALCCRCEEIGWTFKEIAEMALEHE